MTRAVSSLIACIGVAAFASCNAQFHFDVDPDAGAGDSAASDAPSFVCTTDATCAGIRCDVASGTCVACLGDSDCGGSQPRCSTSAHLCVECLERSDCAGKRESCDPTTNRCLSGCFDADDPCPTGFSCNESLELCAECTTSANCNASPNGAVCDPTIGQCVECTTNAQCPSERPVCDLRSGHCQDCVTSASCSPDEICDPSTLTCRSRS